mgnify:CR=1 FL=1
MFTGLVTVSKLELDYPKMHYEFFQQVTNCLLREIIYFFLKC